MKETELSSVIYAISKGKEAFEGALEEYSICMKSGQAPPKTEVKTLGLLLDDLMKKYDLVQFFPESVRPIVKAVMSQPFCYTADILCSGLKEYGKEKTTEEVLAKAAGDFLKSKIIGKIFGD